MLYLEFLHTALLFIWVAILAITAVFIIGAFMVFMFEFLPDKIQEFTQKVGNNDR